MTWWAWIILGSVLFAAELLAVDAQFYLVFIGLSAAAVGLLTWLGVDLPTWIQWCVFGGLSLITMFTFRKTLYDKLNRNLPGHAEGVDGDSLVITQDLTTGQEARIKFRGSDWSVINEGSSTIESGRRVPIVRREGVKLYVNTDTQ